VYQAVLDSALELYFNLAPEDAAVDVPGLTLTPVDEAPRVLLPQGVPHVRFAGSTRSVPFDSSNADEDARAPASRAAGATPAPEDSEDSDSDTDFNTRELDVLLSPSATAASTTSTSTMPRRASALFAAPARPESFLPAPRALPALTIPNVGSFKRRAHVRAGSRSSFTLGPSASASSASLPPIRSPAAEPDPGIPALPAPASAPALVPAPARRCSHVAPLARPAVCLLAALVSLAVPMTSHDSHDGPSIAAARLLETSDKHLLTSPTPLMIRFAIRKHDARAYVGPLYPLPRFNSEVNFGITLDLCFDLGPEDADVPDLILPPADATPHARFSTASPLRVSRWTRRDLVKAALPKRGSASFPALARPKSVCPTLASS
jgi:hypothetical protein